MKITKDSWIGFDLDGTIAEHDLENDYDPNVIGNPIPNMIEKLKEYLSKGIKCKILTARVSGLHNNFNKEARDEAIASYWVIEDWIKKHLGYILEITSSKDYNMLWFYDDRCVQVERDTGKIIGRDFEV